MDCLEFLHKEGWDTTIPIEIPERRGQTLDPSGVRLCFASRQYLRERFPKGLYVHQLEAISRYCNGEDVCVLTSTASGKSLPFYVASIEILRSDPQSRIVAVYPPKALGREQQERWQDAIDAAGLDVKVGRIDGGVSGTDRTGVMQRCRAVVMTPDIVHAWLLSGISEERT